MSVLMQDAPESTQCRPFFDKSTRDRILNQIQTRLPESNGTVIRDADLDRMARRLLSKHPTRN